MLALMINYVLFTDAELHALASMKLSLESLWVEMWSCTSTAIQAVVRNIGSALLDLRIKACTITNNYADDALMLALSENCPNLHRLSIMNDSRCGNKVVHRYRFRLNRLYKCFVRFYLYKLLFLERGIYFLHLFHVAS